MSYIISPKTAAETSEPIDLTRGPFPKTLLPIGTFGTDTIAVKYYDESDRADIDGDTDVYVLYDEFGSAVTIGATSQPVKIDGPIILQFVKGVSSAACGVRLVSIGV